MRTKTGLLTTNGRAGGWRHASALAGRIGSFADQGFQGVANVLSNALLARALTHEQFGVIGVMIGVHYLAWGLHRSAIVLPFILDASDPEADRGDSDAWWWANLVSVLLVGAALGLSAVIASAALRGSGGAWIVRATGYAAVVSPCILALEFGRRRLYQENRAAMAATASGIYGLALTGLSALVLYKHLGEGAGAGAWAVAAGIGAAAAVVASPPKWAPAASAWKTWRAHRRFAFWQAMTAIPYAIYTTIVVVLVGAFGGAPVAAAFTAARTLINPALAAVSAVDTLDKPRAARALAREGLAGLRRSIGATRRTVLLLSGSYLGLLFIFTPQVLQLAFGAAYSGALSSVRVLTAAFFLACLNQASETALIVLRAGRIMFCIRLLAAVLAVVGLWYGARRFGLLGCGVALLITNLTNISALYLAERRFTAEPRA